MTVFY